MSADNLNFDIFYPGLYSTVTCIQHLMAANHQSVMTQGMYLVVDWRIGCEVNSPERQSAERDVERRLHRC